MNISKINFSTTKIQVIVSGKEAGTASGFFFRHKEKKYLATNRHVVIDEDDNFFPDHLRVTLHLNRENLEENCSLPILLYEQGKPLWKQHPLYESNHCDVVLIPLELTTIKPVSFVMFNCSSITFFDSEIINKMSVNPFGDVVVVGYPL